MIDVRIFGHTLGWCFKYIVVLIVLGITYDQLERTFLKDT